MTRDEVIEVMARAALDSINAEQVYIGSGDISNDITIDGDVSFLGMATAVLSVIEAMLCVYPKGGMNDTRAIDFVNKPEISRYC